MKDSIKKLRKILTGFALGLFLTTPAVAEDIEIYTTANLAAPTVQPNIMFIMDSSTGMLATLGVGVPDPYDYTVTYDTAGGYDATRVYYTTDGSIPATNGAYFNWAANKCHHSLEEYIGTVAQGANTGSLYTVGFYVGQMAQYNAQNSKKVWRSLVTNNATTRAYPIECQQDHGIHGETTGDNKKYIANKPDDWRANDTGVAATIWANSANNYTIYAGNYLNYLADTAVPTSAPTLFDQLKGAIATLVAASSNVNIGLARYDGTINFINGIDVGGEGGPIRYPNLDVNLGRQDFYSRLNTMNAGGDPVIAETYFEVLQYFGGKEIVYGNNSVPSNSTGVKENGNPGFYETPITETCQKNYIIAVSNGLSRYDFLEDVNKSKLTGFDITQCNSDTYAPGITNKDAFDSDGSTVDNCLDEMAEWALNGDVAERAFPAHDGNQIITTYTIGFAFPAIASQELLDGEQLLRDTATKGGGRFLQADNEAELVAVLTELVAEILKVNSTFSSPAVSVNAFNRSTNLDDLYFTLFKPADGEHWEGNFKKFKLLFDATTGDPVVSDQNDVAAIDNATGFFKDSSSSYWTQAADAPDGAETALGGAASRIGIPPTRKIYTMTGNYTDNNGVLTPTTAAARSLTSAANLLNKSNAAVTSAMLNISGFTPVIGTTPYRDSLLDWAVGIDVLDFDVDGDTTEARRIMGDPLHAEPGLVQYGLTGGGLPDLVAYVATNDGYLHAVNTLDGSEYFSFVPQELLGNLDKIFVDSGVNGKSYGLDGNVVSWVNDVDRDGSISGSGEHAYIYFGMRRGGDKIYSMDVTNRNSPVLRWMIEGGTGDYAELGQTWSSINVEKVKINDVQTTVLIFGGGYDVAQDGVSQRATDSVGRGVFIVDADTGALLWRAGPDGSADLQLTDMQYSIPSRIKPLDVDGDGYVDRLFVGDMGGQLWRFDIDNKASSTSLAATGGRIADLAEDSDVNETRRFFYPPDVALIVEEGQAPFLSIVAASGYRAHPLNEDIHDRLYMIRDYDVYTVPSPYVTVTESDLFDTTSNVIEEGSAAQIASATSSLSTSQGWYISLNQSNGSWVGEKALAEPLILDGTAIITTYIPAAAGLSSNSCTPNDGTGSIFFVNVTDGTPTYDLSGDDTKTREDRKVYLDRGGIPPTPTVIITEGGTPTLCVGTECDRAGEIGTLQKMYWYEVEQ